MGSVGEEGGGVEDLEREGWCQRGGEGGRK